MRHPYISTIAGAATVLLLTLLAAGQGQGVTEIVKIDPKTLAVTKVISRRDDASFNGGTVATEVGDRLWVGSYGGDRIAVLTP